MAVGKIKVLDETTIDQIAAGEVIENPASIIKELLENAIDAGAKNVTIETKGAGRQLIRVSDDGCGMSKEDLLLAPMRHATSKISTADDLSSIQTLGFRGEALASIAAVSKMTIKSAVDAKGTILEIEGGKVGGPKATSRQRGTTIEVRSLFYNTPARLAFQKSAASDTATIHKTLVGLGLSVPHLGLTWIHDGHVELELFSGQTLLARITQTLGETYADQLLPVESLGYIGKTTCHRPNRLGQFIILNHRFVQCPYLSNLVLECYGTRLPSRRFPIFVLDLELPGGWVDVNVHPQKREVRLAKTDEMERQVRQAIAKCFEPKQTFQYVPVFEESEVVAYSLAEEPTDYQATPAPQMEQTAFLQIKERPIGLFHHYLLLQEDENLQLVDLHRASYRIRFEEVKGAKQALLIPHPVEVTQDEKLFLLEQQEALEEKGLSLRLFGETTILVEAVPNWIELSEIEDLIHEVVENGMTEVSKTVAKRGRKKSYKLEEGLHIIRRLRECNCQETSPDGHPISKVMTKEQIGDLLK